MTTILKTYFKDISKFPLLTAQQEIELSTAYRNGIETEDHKPTSEEKRKSRRAKDKMINSNLRLVISAAKPFRGKHDLEDLISAGNLGLIRAVELFDPDKGNRFSTYALFWIKQKILREIAKDDIKVSERTKDVMSKIPETRESFISENGREPSVKELAELLSVTERTILAASSGSVNVVSIDDLIGKDGDNSKTLIELIEDEKAASPDQKIESDEINRVIREVLENLSPRDECILRMRFGIGENPKNSKDFPIYQSELNEIKERSEKEKEIKRVIQQ